MSDGPTFEVIGDLSDEAIEALASLLLSATAPEKDELPQEVGQEPRV